MKVVLITILLAAMLGACRRKVFHYTTTNPEAQSKVQKLKIDESFDFYVRQVFEDQVDNENKLRPGLRDMSKLIEVEYLFISGSKVVYISTMPDKYKMRYRNHYLGDQYVNAWDFKTFLFGELQNNEITFSNSKEKLTDTWGISHADGGVYINYLVERLRRVFEYHAPVEEALSHKVFFRKIDDPMLVFHRNGYPKEDTVPLLNKTVYLLPGKSKNWLYFKFEKPIYNRYSTIFFRDDRIIYDPGKLFD